MKEILFDVLIPSDEEWPRKLTVATRSLMHHFIESQVASRRSVIVESCFNSEAETAFFQKLIDTYAVNVVQILCKANKKVIPQRLLDRYNAGQRHRCHLGPLHPTMEDDYYTIRTKGPLLVFDTTDFKASHYMKLYHSLRQFLRAASLT